MVSYTLIFMLKYLSVQSISYSEYIGWNTLFPFCLGKWYHVILGWWA